MTVVAMLTVVCVSAQRECENLNFGWEFRLNDEGDWRKVDVPHDFQIEQDWVEFSSDKDSDNNGVPVSIINPLARRGFKEMGKGCYRLHYTPREEMKGRRVLLDFEGILYTADVYLNHKRIGGTDYGYVGFEIDITDHLAYGEDNLIEVVADTRQPENSRWYTGGGLIRNVSLITTPKDLFFCRHPFYITTRDNRYVSISAEFTNRTKEEASRIALQIQDAKGKTVYRDTVADRKCGSLLTSTLPMPRYGISTHLIYIPLPPGCCVTTTPSPTRPQKPSDSARLSSVPTSASGSTGARCSSRAVPTTTPSAPSEPLPIPRPSRSASGS